MEAHLCEYQGGAVPCTAAAAGAQRTSFVAAVDEVRSSYAADADISGYLYTDIRTTARYPDPGISLDKYILGPNLT